MIRAIVCPPDVPENYQEIIIVFAEQETKRGKTGTMMHFGGSFLDALRRMSIADRMRVIKQFCSNIEQSLLQSSSNPDDFKIREITGQKTC